MLGQSTPHPATISSFSTSSSEVNLGGSYHAVYLVVPTMTSNSTLYVQASDASGGTFRRVLQKDPASAAASVDFMVLSSTTNRIVQVPLHGLQYVKVESEAVLSFSAGFKFVCGP